MLGRSPNRTLGISGIWNPSLGPYRLVEAYDAIKAVGPGYAWYPTSASANSHRSGRTVRAMVFVPYQSAGGSFDISKVTLVYRYGVLR